MQTNRIKYIGFYDIGAHADENRNTFLAATNKMDYIASAIVRAGYSVNIISPSWSCNFNGVYKGRVEKIALDTFLTVGPTFGARGCVLRKFRIIWSWIWLFFYLCFNTQKNEKILVYHSMMLIYPVLLAKKIKKFKMILEVEEIYQDVTNFSKTMTKMEYSMFDSADKYLFSTELLNEKLNTNKKPYVVIYGAYCVENLINNSCFQNDKIHVIYAGIIDQIKGGAFAAAQSALYLSEKFHIHIIGFGSKEDVEALKLMIFDIAGKTLCRITYDGILKGKEYNSFLQNCAIGLSTQVPDEKYINTSFPSKILSYLSNNLRVVSMRIPCVEYSKIGKEIWYYNEQDPRKIAEIIESINLNCDYDSKSLINKLDEDFINTIARML